MLFLLEYNVKATLIMCPLVDRATFGKARRLLYCKIMMLYQHLSREIAMGLFGSFLSLSPVYVGYVPRF